ncbi:hypothetical protein BGW36DRAFT_392093 [Talaromyces proteolyticus]|uniref:Ester cyclase n=1 Tax=Talaromyces proteolyticus TaxID=1131652 RepID=A0AAD4KCS1_9EURO|nr:uncharacterized protein BGW36DRAFT_392093 [Talaromyces proteolyticus]KAH8688733.1 hypothetical protein BGW36DRAFT_392093 [Talaromyces proteolyticus]
MDSSHNNASPDFLQYDQTRPISVVEVDLNPDTLSHHKNVVRRFYKELWDKHDTTIIPDLIHDDLTFRGSLGPVLVGHSQFASYVNWLTGVLGLYTSDILDLIEEGTKVTAKLRFHGIHNDHLFGQPPTRNWVWWHGVAIFTFEDGKIKDLWVLGDIHGLIGRLNEAVPKLEFVAIGPAAG